MHSYSTGKIGLLFYLRNQALIEYSSCSLITTVHCRYMIPRYTDVEQFFSVGPEDGIIKTTRPLDRETLPWHNISVSATEIGTPPSTIHPGFQIRE
jgi:hypothetical protein